MSNYSIFSNFRFVIYRYKSYHYTDNRHGSPQHYLAYMESGSATLVSDDRTVEIAPGDIFYIPKGLPYQSYWRAQGEIILRSYGFDYFPESNMTHYLMQTIPCDDTLRTRIRSIPTERPTDSHLLGWFYSALADLLPFMVHASSSNSYLLAKAKWYLTVHPDCKIGDIAKYCLISEASLYALFKKELGITPNMMRQQILCEKAQLLLTTTDRSVQQISDSLGFSSPSYFRKILYAHTGQTPRQIRNSSTP